MDKIFSTRINDTIYRKINDLSVKMRASKKSIIEKAINLLGQRFEQDNAQDIFSETCGIWKRDDTPKKILSHTKTVFRESMKRYHQ